VSKEPDMDRYTTHTNSETHVVTLRDDSRRMVGRVAPVGGNWAGKLVQRLGAGEIEVRPSRDAAVVAVCDLAAAADGSGR